MFNIAGLIWGASVIDFGSLKLAQQKQKRTAHLMG